MSGDIDFAAAELDLERSILRDSFGDFAAWAWPLITGLPFVPNRATEALVAALQSVADGKVWRLLVAIPPGCGKSTLLACYSAWRLARDASWRSIRGSHSYELAATESRRVRRLVEGDAFRRLFPSVALREDENTAAFWATSRGGSLFACGVGGGLTGRRSHEAVLDDPLNAIDRFSKAARDTLWAWFTEALLTRLDGDRAPTVVVQQRLDRDDLIGRLIAAGGWTLLELPAEDEHGTLLAPNVLGREKLDALKSDIGSAAYATQYLQRPADDGNATVKRAWWRFHRPAHVSANAPRPAGCDLETPAVDTPSSFSRVTIAADLTFGSTTGDFAVVQAWGEADGGRYLLEQVRARMGFEQSLAAIEAMAQRHAGARVVVEKAANGAAVIEALRRTVPTVIALKPQGSKAQRLAAVAPQIEAGSAYLPLGASWLGDFVEELAGGTKHDDAMDACAYALADLAERPPPQRVHPGFTFSLTTGDT